MDVRPGEDDLRRVENCMRAVVLWVGCVDDGGGGAAGSDVDGAAAGRPRAAEERLLPL